MSDYIVRATAADASIRAFAITSRDLVETARKDHNTSPIMTAALGRLLSGGAMMGTMLKNDKDLVRIPLKTEAKFEPKHTDRKIFLGLCGVFVVLAAVLIFFAN